VVLITTKARSEGQNQCRSILWCSIGDEENGYDECKRNCAIQNERGRLQHSYLWSIYQSESLGEGVDWQDQIYHKAPMSNYQLSISGGSDKSQYFISGGYRNRMASSKVLLSTATHCG
jgi:hypothetical protein